MNLKQDELFLLALAYVLGWALQVWGVVALIIGFSIYYLNKNKKSDIKKVKAN